MIKYLGSKRVLIDAILTAVRATGAGTSVIDLFSGTSRVGHALKRAGYRVIANDHNAYASVLARCYVEADREEIERPARMLIDELMRLPGRAGWFTETYCERARYFQPKNGARIEAMRDAIAQKDLPPELEAVMLTSLMEAADRVDSTTGVQMAWLKSWAQRSGNDVSLRLPDVLSRAAAGKGEAHALDALDAAARLEADVAYVDPPYNQHSYLGNYHVWETLVRWDQPEVYGVACKRVDVRDRRSAFNGKNAAAVALARVIETLRARSLVVSFSDEGYVARDAIESMLRARGEVTVIARDHKRYVGAQIGIYNPSGAKVGQVSHLRNTEYIFVVTERPLREKMAQLALFEP
ncbi:MAG: DNA adenine methylase [Myxococcota bacterium]|nr:DNA adenine methylase [Myxococcota bacterium]